MTKKKPETPPPMVALAMQAPPFGATHPWIGAHECRPYSASGAMMLMGEQSDIYAHVTAHARDRRIAEILSSPTNSRLAALAFDGLPNGLVFCYACMGSGKHFGCCFGEFCSHDQCTTCDGVGWVIPSGRFVIQVHEDGPYVDAGLLRLALMHLGTHSVVLGTSGAEGPVVMSASGRCAVVMPTLGFDLVNQLEMKQ